VGTKLGGGLRPDTKSKLRKVREDLNKQLKIEATKEQKEEVCLFLLDAAPFAKRLPL
jgi:hypothetical protein